MPRLPRSVADGGNRGAANRVYENYVRVVDRALEAVPNAAVTVAATGTYSKIEVTATVAKMDGAEPQLTLILAEKRVRYTGENGIRFHPMVVRAVSDPVTLRTTGTHSDPVSITHAFDLSTVRADLEQTLRAETTKRGIKTAESLESQGAMSVDPSELVVVAFLQDKTKHVLQTAQVDVTVRK
jgi:hypothetical protein